MEENDGMTQWLAINVSLSMVVFTIVMLAACGIFLTLVLLSAAPAAGVSSTVTDVLEEVATQEVESGE